MIDLALGQRRRDDPDHETDRGLPAGSQGMIQFAWPTPAIPMRAGSTLGLGGEEPRLRLDVARVLVDGRDAELAGIDAARLGDRRACCTTA